MSYDINAEIAIRKAEVVRQLDEANPSVEPLVEAIEDELEFVFEQFFYTFDELFLDNGIATGTYEGLTEADVDVIEAWQSSFLNKAIRRWHEKLASRVIETTEPVGGESEEIS